MEAYCMRLPQLNHTVPTHVIEREYQGDHAGTVTTSEKLIGPGWKQGDYNVLY